MLQVHDLTANPFHPDQELPTSLDCARRSRQSRLVGLHRPRAPCHWIVALLPRLHIIWASDVSSCVRKESQRLIETAYDVWSLIVSLITVLTGWANVRTSGSNPRFQKAPWMTPPTTRSGAPVVPCHASSTQLGHTLRQRHHFHLGTERISH